MSKELKIFAIYDSKAHYYRRPFFMKTKGEAVRGFVDVVNDGKSEISLHPEDFTLFHIGDYDEDRGKVTDLGTNVSLGVAIEYLREDYAKSMQELRSAINKAEDEEKES